eukprot:GHVR01156280.1.p1 GENE.GHVR01156280.1~~GHVR01156280.1.p1  ORF type:complete len:269 (-),score=47.51 GHVR01156280.1:296-1057(-)
MTVVACCRSTLIWGTAFVQAVTGVVLLLIGVLVPAWASDDVNNLYTSILNTAPYGVYCFFIVFGTLLLIFSLITSISTCWKAKALKVIFSVSTGCCASIFFLIGVSLLILCLLYPDSSSLSSSLCSHNDSFLQTFHTQSLHTHKRVCGNDNVMQCADTFKHAHCNTYGDAACTNLWSSVHLFTLMEGVFDCGGACVPSTQIFARVSEDIHAPCILTVCVMLRRYGLVCGVAVTLLALMFSAAIACNAPRKKKK